ncbi:type IV secretion system protein [Bosea sp. Root670]|uniref:type IV secretion system protein n=1 Tax=Bosea sp. Root670 TaxID=1736583 RepID=UPI00138F6814|nr:type IV secretion system protein [Bosea sp. Root670]
MIALAATSISAFAQSRGDWTDFKQAVAQRESANNATVVNQYGYAGLYQMGTAALIDAGYIKQGTPSRDNSAMNNPYNWTGKDGVYALNQYLNNTSAQSNAWEAYQAQNWKTMQGLNLTLFSGKTMADGTIITDSGLIFASQFGVGKVKAYLENGGNCVPGKGTATNDGNGICVAEYMKKGAGYDVSEFTKKAESLQNFTPQDSADRGNANGLNTAQSGGSAHQGSVEEIGCWPCKILQPIAAPLDAFLQRGNEIGKSHGVWIASMLAGFGTLVLAGGAMLGVLSNWRELGKLLLGLAVISALLSSPGWLWGNVGAPIFNATIAIGSEFVGSPSRSAGGYACTNANPAGNGQPEFRLPDEASYDIARRLQATDQLGGSGGSATPGSATEGAGTGSSGAISQIVTAADCSIRAAIAQPNYLLSHAWWGVKKNMKSSLWSGFSNIPLILQTIVIFLAYIGYTLVLGILFVVAMFQVAIGAATLPLTLPAALFRKSRPMSWWSVKMIAQPAVHLVLITMVAAVLNAAIKQVMDAYGFAAGADVFGKMFNDGAIPLEMFITVVGAMCLALFMMKRCEGWSEAATHWLGYGGNGFGGAALAAWQNLVARGR